MLNLRQLGIGITLINQRIQLFNRLPHAHPCPDILPELLPRFKVVRKSLLCMLFGVEILDTIAGRFVVPEIILVLFRIEFGFLVVRGRGGRLLALDDVDFIDCVREVLELLALALLLSLENFLCLNHDECVCVAVQGE
jgi:hypothetical protein